MIDLFHSWSDTAYLTYGFTCWTFSTLCPDVFLFISGLFFASTGWPFSLYQPDFFFLWLLFGFINGRKAGYRLERGGQSLGMYSLVLPCRTWVGRGCVLLKTPFFWRVVLTLWVSYNYRNNYFYNPLWFLIMVSSPYSFGLSLWVFAISYWFLSAPIPSIVVNPLITL